MSEFPTSFSEELLSLPDDFKPEIADNAEALSQQGFEVVQGITPYYAGSIALMATQQHIRKFCPKDQTEQRFGSEESTKQWLKKDGGRAVFLLLQDLEAIGQRLAGYGWTGNGTTPNLDDAETTFAIRIGQANLRKNLTIPFTGLIIESSRTMFDARNFWLETWESNAAAVTSYKAVGFEVAHEEPVVRKEPRRKEFPDNRLYMQMK